mmetsp:Transcript_5422/g.13350  ORF Transcript_5422/g.13350 Transcript_5422/m.13350 type:complete len:641 (-) Transcript_5422:132-2054(-)
MKKGKAKAKAGGKKAPKEEKEVAAEGEDWLGEASDDEDRIVDSDEDSDAATGVADEGSEEEDDDGGDEVDDDGEAGALAVRDDDDDGGEVRHKSKVLSRVISGEQPADLSAIKQRIHDAAALLSNWRKAKQLGDKRTREEVLSGLVGDCSTYFGYSEELAEYFLRMFAPEQAIQFFEANEKSRPLTIRTNSLKARRQSLMQSLTARKVQVDPIGAWTKVGLKVYESAVPVGATPEYLGGQYMIQSASSFVPVMALAPQMNETVLDMAAAPGGKTTYIGQLMKNTGTLFANDLRKERCKALVANVHRMGLTNVIVTCMDGKKLGGMLPRLDRVLLDAPCSGSGIIARDPSVKVKRGTKDFEETSRLQKELLNTAIDMVDANSKTGGYIVYSTCSVSVEENEAVVEHALKTRSVELVSFSSAVNFGVEGMTKFRESRFHPSMSMCRRYYPHVHNMDGFFVAKFKKTSNTIPERTKKDRSKGTDHIQVWGEEHWTPDMMETVVDFPPPGSSAAPADGKRLNKKERKKIKRAAQLAARAAAAISSATGEAAASSSAAAVASKPDEPEEEPQPPAKAAAKKKVLKKRKAPAATVAEPEGAEGSPEAQKAEAGKKRKLVKKKKASGGDAAAPASSEGGKKKRRKVA